MPRPFASSVAAIATAVGCLASPARADTNRTTSLSWVELPGAEGCGGGAAMTTAVEQRLGRHALVPADQSDVSIDARAERSGHPPVWRAVIVLRDRDGILLGTRELVSTSSDCAELRSSVALAVALMIDPDAALRPDTSVAASSAPGASPSQSSSPTASAQPDSAPPAASPDSTSAEPPSAPSAPMGPAAKPAPPKLTAATVTTEDETPAPASASPSGWSASAAAAFAVGFGFLPSAGVGLRLGVTVSPPSFWDFEVFGGVWGDQTVVVPGAQVRFSLPFAGLALCPLRVGRTGGVRLSMCAGTEIDFLESRPQGFASAKDSLDPALSVVVPARLLVPITSSFGVSLGGELGATLVRNRFFYDDASGNPQVLASRPVFSAAGDAGLIVFWP
jgi:hypothetical protein